MFCTQCGTKNDEAVSFCGNCGNSLKAPAQGGSTQAVLQNAMKSSIVQDTVELVKTTFSKNPEFVLDKALKTKSHNWVITIGLAVILLGLTLRFLPIHIIPSDIRNDPWIGDGISQMINNFTVYGIVLQVMLSAVTIGLVIGLLKLNKINVEPVKAANLVGASGLIYSGFALIGLFAGFASVPAMLGLNVFGRVAEMFMLFLGIKLISENKISPFWNVGIILLANVIGTQLAGIFSPDVIPGLGGGSIFDLILDGFMW